MIRIAPFEGGFEFSFRAWMGNRVGRVLEHPANGREEFRAVSAVGVGHSVLPVGTDETGQPRGDFDAAWWQRDIFDCRNAWDTHFPTESDGNLLSGLLALRCGRFVRHVSPGPETAAFLSCGHPLPRAMGRVPRDPWTPWRPSHYDIISSHITCPSMRFARRTAPMRKRRGRWPSRAGSESSMTETAGGS